MARKKQPISNVNDLLIKGLLHECCGNERAGITGPDCRGIVMVAHSVPHTVVNGEVHIIVDADKNVVLVGEYRGMGWGGATQVSYANAYVMGARKNHPIWKFANRECFHVVHREYIRKWYATKADPTAPTCILLHGGEMVLVIDGDKISVTREQYNTLMASGTVRFCESYDNGRAFGTNYTKMEPTAFHVGEVRHATRDMKSDPFFAVGS